MSYMYILASLYTQYFVKCPTQDSQVDGPTTNGTILLKIKIHSFIHSFIHSQRPTSVTALTFPPLIVLYVYFPFLQLSNALLKLYTNCIIYIQLKKTNIYSSSLIQ